jgi:hypothetical protein
MHIKYIRYMTGMYLETKQLTKGGGGHWDALKEDHVDFWHKSYLLGGIAMQENSKMYLTLWKI